MSEASKERTEQNRFYKTNEICDIFDISKSTLYRWEREGIISKVARDWRNWRVYSLENHREIELFISRKKI